MSCIRTVGVKWVAGIGRTRQSMLLVERRLLFQPITSHRAVFETVLHMYHHHFLLFCYEMLVIIRMIQCTFI